jgi:hypothetical protein
MSSAVMDNTINDLSNLTLTKFTESDTGFKSMAIFVIAVIMAWFLYSQNKRSKKYEKIMARYKKLGIAGTEGQESIKNDMNQLAGLGVGTMGFWITAGSGLALLVMMFVM